LIKYACIKKLTCNISARLHSLTEMSRDRTTKTEKSRDRTVKSKSPVQYI